MASTGNLRADFHPLRRNGFGVSNGNFEQILRIVSERPSDHMPNAHLNGRDCYIGQTRPMQHLANLLEMFVQLAFANTDTLRRIQLGSLMGISTDILSILDIRVFFRVCPKICLVVIPGFLNVYRI